MSASATTQKYGTILTAAGKAAVANAVVTNTLIEIKHIALGTGAGSEYYPTESQTALKNQVYQMEANSVYVDADNPNWIVVEGLIPESAGGWTIREAAIKMADGTVFAIGSYPSSYKPKLEEGSAVGIGFKFIMQVTNADVVSMNIDPSTVYATIQYVDKSISNHASQTNVHGGTYLVTPNRLMLRNDDGRCQVEAPIEPKDAANKEWTEEALNDAVDALSGLFGSGARMFVSRTSGFWTVPDGVYQVLLYLTGGGASGARPGQNLEASGGSAGGTAIASIAVTPGQKIDFVIGSGGSIPALNSNGNNGGASTCLGVTASGGVGGRLGDEAQSHFVPAGGSASGGMLNLRGGPGSAGFSSREGGPIGGDGGSSFWGGGGVGSAWRADPPQEDMNGGAPGAGGGGGNGGIPDNPDYRAGAGEDGIIVISY